MNLKLLKFIVIFMGLLIILGFIILIIGIYDKMQGGKRTVKDPSNLNITIKKPSNMNLISHKLNKNIIILNYENKKKLKIIIFDLSLGEKIKEIDVLK